MSGVPQGSILGTSNFTIYMNDLPQSLSSSVFMFADDMKLIRILFSQLLITIKFRLLVIMVCEMGIKFQHLKM